MLLSYNTIFRKKRVYSRSIKTDISIFSWLICAMIVIIIILFHFKPQVLKLWSLLEYLYKYNSVNCIYCLWIQLCLQQEHFRNRLDFIFVIFLYQPLEDTRTYNFFCFVFVILLVCILVIYVRILVIFNSGFGKKSFCWETIKFIHLIPNCFSVDDGTASAIVADIAGIAVPESKWQVHVALVTYAKVNESVELFWW